MIEAGIDTSIFKSHSVRGATCSKAADAGATTKQILDAADCSSKGTYQQFYHRRLENKDKTSFGRNVFSPGCASNNTC